MEQDEEDPPKEARAAKAERAFDLWLNCSLHRLYDGVAQEPIPDELLRLIEADRAKRKA